MYILYCFHTKLVYQKQLAIHRLIVNVKKLPTHYAGLWIGILVNNMFYNLIKVKTMPN